MSDSSKADGSSDREKFAEAFGRTTDPLAELEETFLRVDADPFAPVIEEDLRPQGLHPHTFQQYRTVFDEWREHMQREGRHPACPSVQHVIRFIGWQVAPEEAGGPDNDGTTVRGKIRKLNRAYEFWQRDSAFPIPTDYNPFDQARQKKRSVLRGQGTKEHRRIPVAELREMLAGVSNLRKRAIIGVQFKLGLRAGEVTNIKLSDLTLADTELQGHFPEMGAAHRVADRTNAIYIPDRTERSGNKSKRPRVLPLDDELRRLLKRYLLVRPDNGEPWLFLSQNSHSQLRPKAINVIWKDEFHPAYAESEEYRPVTSHFGRHRFVTWWSVQQELGEEDSRLAYMRGDEHKSDVSSSMAAYIHTYYEDIEDLYLENIYKLLP